jgi:hypothetical protein
MHDRLIMEVKYSCGMVGSSDDSNAMQVLLDMNNTLSLLTTDPYRTIPCHSFVRKLLHILHASCTHVFPLTIIPSRHHQPVIIFTNSE